MKSRRWFVTEELRQWRYMMACGDMYAPLFWFPRDPYGFINVLSKVAARECSGKLWGIASQPSPLTKILLSGRVAT